MPHEYTRQRQGRDFFTHFTNAETGTESKHSNINGVTSYAPPKDVSEEKRDLLNRLGRFKAEAERNAEPVDGHEPVTERAR